jgi:hypothetical protein
MSLNIDNPVIVVDGTPINSYNPEFNNYLISDRSIISSGYISENYSGREFRKYIYKNVIGEVVKVSPWIEYINTITINGDSLPTVNNVILTGSAKPSGTLVCQYTFADADGEFEGTTLFKWYYAKNRYEVPKIIEGASSGHYTILGNTLSNCYIMASIRPVSVNGSIADKEYFSNVVGPIPFSYDYPIVTIGDFTWQPDVPNDQDNDDDDDDEILDPEPDPDPDMDPIVPWSDDPFWYECTEVFNDTNLDDSQLIIPCYLNSPYYASGYWFDYVTAMASGVIYPYDPYNFGYSLTPPDNYHGWVKWPDPFNEFTASGWKFNVT